MGETMEGQPSGQGRLTTTWSQLLRPAATA